MKKLLPLFFLAFIATNSFEQGCPANLFFSEYTEGSSFNKAVEIYNPLPYAVDLSDYNLEMFTNGSPTVSSTFVLDGTLNPGGTYVVCNPSANASFLALKDTTSGVINFNGDDAFILKNNVTNDTLDVIGIVGNDPGTNWVVGTGATSEFTLVRMSNVAIGTTNWALSTTQWNVLPQNDITNLGLHTFTAPMNEYFLQDFTICANDSILINGNYLKTPGVYNDTLLAMSGCDSIVMTEIFHNPTFLTFIDTTTCPGNIVFLEGANQTIAGIYHDTLTTIFGCDSVLEWNLSFYVEDFISLAETICEGDSLFLEGGWQLLDGVYTDVYTSVLTGCDSTVETTLTVQTVDVSVTQSGFDLSANNVGQTYQWLDCGNGMSEVVAAVGVNFTPTSDGEYAVEVTENGCIDTSSCFTISGIGFEEMNAVSVNVMPNPFTDFVQIYFESESAIIQISDIKGAVQFNGTAMSSPFISDLSDLKNGYYVVTVISGNELVKVPVIKQ
jgi:hypothetical protein